MGNEIQQSKNLEERIKAKLHESIGDLITPEDLKHIVETGVHAALWKPRVRTQYDGWRERMVAEPPLVEQLVDEHLGKQMRAAVEQWLNDHPDELRAAIDDAIRRGVSDALIRTMDERFGSVFEHAVNRMRMDGVLPAVSP